MRGDQGRYIEFADRMIRAVHGKSIYSSKAATTDFEDLVMPSQEAFTLLLYRNGYKNWVSVHDTSAMTSSSQESEADQRPAYQYTTRKHADLTSRNGGWSREGNDKYVELYDRVKQDRLIDNGVFKRKYMAHWIEKRAKMRKRRRNDTVPNGIQGEDRDDVGVLTALMHENEQSATTADAPTQAVDGTVAI
jgi:hypothetical protein